VRAAALGVVFGLALCAQAAPQRPAAAPGAFQPPDWTLPEPAERAYHALSSRVDGDAAMDIVRFMDQYWRIAANPGFNRSIDHIQQTLQAAGLATRVEEFVPRARGWDYDEGTVSFADSGEVLMSRQRDRVSLCINSFSTPGDGVVATLVDVGSGSRPADYEGKDVKGAVVLGSASAGELWREAVKARGAIGVISTGIAPYIRPEDSSQFTSPDQWDVLQWSSVPYDAERKAFGFKSSLRAASRMRERLKAGAVRLKITVQSTFYDGPSRSLIAEIPGTTKPDERIVMVAHVQEPGANDDGSGCGTLAALAAAIASAIHDGALRSPGRTLTFIWADEVAGSRNWLMRHADQAKSVQYMFAMDMTGEDTSRTGGTFLIEKQPDPSAVWDRPSDPHTGWGGRPMKAESLKGSLLNDLHLAVCLRRARDTGWVVKTNPYEGGSDHTAFGEAGIPALLNWHFTDRFYHTNLDRPDKTSAAEMVNVGSAVATSAWFLASASERDALAVVDLIAASAAARLALERGQGPGEREVQAAWIKWYREALESARALAVTGASNQVDAKVAAASRALQDSATR
jgi:aminopeptidase YwaD